MSNRAQRIVQAEESIGRVQDALDRTQGALSVVEEVDAAATRVARRGSRLLKLIVLLTIIGIVALVIMKMTGRSHDEETASDRDDAFGANRAS